MTIKSAGFFTLKLLLCLCLATSLLAAVVIATATFMAYQSSEAWLNVKASRSAYWDALEEKARPDQKKDIAYIRQKTEGKVCGGSFDLEYDFFLGYEDTRLGILKREKDCLTSLKMASLGTSQTQIHDLVEVLEHHTEQAIENN